MTLFKPFDIWILGTHFLVRVVTPFIPFIIQDPVADENYHMWVFVWDNQALCYNPENTTSDICNSYLWLRLRSSGWKKALLELAWDFDPREGCWSLDCGGGRMYKLLGLFYEKRLKVGAAESIPGTKTKALLVTAQESWSLLCCGFVSPRYHPHSCGWSSLHLRVGPRLQELLQKFMLVKEDSAIGEILDILGFW